ncbi:hypothetical protein M427DRAFT_73294 [Gonapodya prolifera JEL478]|uniref:Amino acid transporter n=1 Tax=Gonapodya prolifera (strain JEL478) TaxID=1344416 RepID=A0A139A2W3_GONPJ|nr:hypothetical protein M427DRAFT_73294 [Gonapodya prolifera JEL478]|eukprot:KXS11084.1 hypothetical protein M427DRAFT_73294 [Gonapodya prolifera JEL478]
MRWLIGGGPSEAAGPSKQLELMINITEDELRLAKSFGEHSSGSWPSAGGLYYWSAKLGGQTYGPMISWFTACLNLIGEIGAISSSAYALSLLIFSCISLGTDGADASQWQIILLSIAIVCSWGFLNSFDDVVLARMMELSVAVQILGPIAITAILLAFAPYNNFAEFIFTKFQNYTGQDSLAYAVMLGLVLPAWNFIGYDPSTHISEETVNAYRDVPKSIICAVLVTSVVGLILILGMAATVQHDNLIEQNPQRAITPLLVYYDIVNHMTYAITLAAIVGLAIYFSGLAAITANSRMMFAFARDDGFGPRFSFFLRSMHPKTRLPLRNVWFSVALCTILTAIGLGLPEGATQGVLTVATLGLMAAYALPTFCKLVLGREFFKRGELTLGLFSTSLGYVAVLWVCTILILLCFPFAFP